MYMLVANEGIVDTVLNGCAITFLTELDDLVAAASRWGKRLRNGRLIESKVGDLQVRHGLQL